MKKILFLLSIILILPLVYAEGELIASSGTGTPDTHVLGFSSSHLWKVTNTTIPESSCFDTIAFKIQQVGTLDDSYGYTAMVWNESPGGSGWTFTDDLAPSAIGINYTAFSQIPSGGLDYINFTLNRTFCGSDGIKGLSIGMHTNKTGDASNYVQMSQQHTLASGNVVSALDQAPDGAFYANWGQTWALTNIVTEYKIFNTTVAAAGASPDFEVTVNNTYFGETLLNFSVFVDGGNYTTTTGTIATNLTQNHTTLEDVTVYSENHDTRVYSNLNLSTNLEATLNFSYYRLNVTMNESGGGEIHNFTIIAETNDGGRNITDTALGSHLMMWLSKDMNYNLTADVTGYSIAYKNISMDFWLLNTTFIMNPNNAIDITIKDEDSLALIASNTSITFNGNSSTFVRYTANGTYLAIDLTPEEYDITFEVLDGALEYGTRTYTLTVGNRSYQTLEALLAKNVETTIFTIRDKDTGSLLQDVSTTQQRRVNSTWTTIETKDSDITGRTQFSYVPNVKYRFILTKANYNELSFELNPILFGAYNIELQKTSTESNAEAFDRVSVTNDADVFYNAENTFNIIYQSSYGELTGYGYMLLLPNGTNFTNSGSNAIGSQLTTVFNMSGFNNAQSVKLDYYYITSLEGRRNFTSFYPISSNLSTNTFFSNRDDPTFGLPLLDRVIIMTIVLLIVLGITALIGQVVWGIGISILLMGFFAYVQLIPLWIVLPSIFVIFIIISSRVGET